MALKDFFKKTKKIASKVGAMTIAAVMGMSTMASATPLYNLVETTETPIVQYVQAESAETGAEPKMQVSDFKDNIGGHWGAATIQWGLDRDMVGGYPDGTFLPDRAVTEAEFAVMLARYADNTDKTFFGTGVTSGHWSQEYYNSLMDFLLPLNGYMEGTDNVKNTSITRVRVAQVLAAKYGFNLGEQQAVYFLYENGLSQGRTAMNYEGFSPGAYLTRAEIVQFIRNMDNLGDKQLTFLGKTSVKGACDADTIVGIQGVVLDNTPVDFTKWVPAVVGSGITTKVVNGKVVVEMNKITEGTTITGVKSKVMNYFDYDANAKFSGAPMNNSVAKVNGVELPMNSNFKTTRSLNDGGLVNIEIDDTESKIGSFTDKEVFKALLPNLSSFQASQAQINKAVEMVNTWYGKTDPKEVIYLPVNSKSKNSTMLIRYGNGDVSVTMYNKSGVADGMGTPITVE